MILSKWWFIFVIFTVNTHKSYGDKTVDLVGDSVYDAVSKDLFDKVKVFCLVLTGKENKKNRAIPQKNTFLKRCNKYLFVSSVEDPDLPSIGIKVKESRNTLFAKIKFGMKYVYKNYYQKYDWFLRIDDDSYVIMENLRMFLLTQNTSEPAVHGFRFHSMMKGSKKGLVHGGAGTVISKEGLKRLVTESFPNPTKCRQDGGGLDDRELSFCLEMVGVYPSDTRDYKDRQMFHINPPDNYATTRKVQAVKYFIKNGYYPMSQGMAYMTDYPISFHRIYGDMMYSMDYLLYKANVIGRSSSYLQRLISSRDRSNLIQAAKKGIRKFAFEYTGESERQWDLA
uniref:N-acetylgalactosaminide beta-1,3-galactosyltransferase n=1 Tax=Rhabditophanes sp. KR3021 TaxID=114890 RepID=A0AC35UA37_9BILA